MSLNPGIGATAIKKLIAGGAQSQRVMKHIQSIDAPVVLRRNGSILPLGRYLRRIWRESLGRPPDTPKPILGQYHQELQKLLKENEQKTPSGTKTLQQRAAFHHWNQNKNKILSLEKRVKIYAKEKTI